MSESAQRLCLRAEDLEDLGVISSMVQDALVPPGDMAYLPEDGQFLLALNRFRWEAAGDAPPFSRTHAGLRFDRVTGVQRRNLGRGERDRILSMLSIAYHGDTVVLIFAENAAIRLTVGKLAVALDDLGEPWPTPWKPGHDPDTV